VATPNVLMLHRGLLCRLTLLLEAQSNTYDLTVGLGDTLKLVLLLNGIRVGRTLGGVDQLISQALSNGLDVPEGSLASL
jgi:hypothetical protein